MSSCSVLIQVRNHRGERVWQDVMQTHATESWWEVHGEKTKGRRISLPVPAKKFDSKPSQSLYFFYLLPFSVFIRNNSTAVKKTEIKMVFFLLRLEINLFITLFEMENEQWHVLARTDRTTTAKKYFPLWKNKNIKLLWSGFCIMIWQKEVGSMKRDKNTLHDTRAMKGIFYLPLSKQNKELRMIHFFYEILWHFFLI